MFSKSSAGLTKIATPANMLSAIIISLTYKARAESVNLTLPEVEWSLCGTSYEYEKAKRTYTRLTLPIPNVF